MATTSRPNALGPAFADPVIDAQLSFREILAALAEPGTMRRLKAEITPPDGLAPAATIALLVLADHETPVWLPPASTEAARYLLFHTGAARAESPGCARFAIVDGSSEGPPLAAFDPGDDRYPDRSATVVVQCTALSGGAPVVLQGPGIRDRRRVSPTGLRAEFWSEVAANTTRYPLGIDLLLVSGRDIIGLPRSTRVTAAEGR
ncbi:MAG: phosphonate C-P lyase system protein PhnH [Hyphomicrobiaceae bacterium]|nr:phosphonate C-P lyase system protein PhnH [Hyphomicrobiaceae bacterium]